MWHRSWSTCLGQKVVASNPAPSLSFIVSLGKTLNPGCPSGAGSSLHGSSHPPIGVWIYVGGWTRGYCKAFWGTEGAGKCSINAICNFPFKVPGRSSWLLCCFLSGIFVQTSWNKPNQCSHAAVVSKSLELISGLHLCIFRTDCSRQYSLLFQLFLQRGSWLVMKPNWKHSLWSREDWKPSWESPLRSST